jgi:hypothetical protein
MKRREFITLLGGAATWPLAARAQQQPAKAARIGYLSAASAPDVNIESFRQGMRSFGYVEGPDFVIEPRYAERDYSRFPILIEELLRAKVELIVTGGPSSRAAPLAGFVLHCFAEHLRHVAFAAPPPVRDEIEIYVCELDKTGMMGSAKVHRVHNALDLDPVSPRRAFRPVA